MGYQRPEDPCSTHCRHQTGSHFLEPHLCRQPVCRLHTNCQVYFRPGRPLLSLRTRRSVEKEACLCILNHPCQALLQVLARHCTTPEDAPTMRANRIKLKTLPIVSRTALHFGRGRSLSTSRRLSCTHPRPSCWRRRAGWRPTVAARCVRIINNHRLRQHPGGPGGSPLPAEDGAALSCSPRRASGRSHQPPISGHPSSQSSSANTTAVFSDHRRPLVMLLDRQNPSA